MCIWLLHSTVYHTILDNIFVHYASDTSEIKSVCGMRNIWNIVDGIVIEFCSYVIILILIILYHPIKNLFPNLIIYGTPLASFIESRSHYKWLRIPWEGLLHSTTRGYLKQYILAWFLNSRVTGQGTSVVAYNSSGLCCSISYMLAYMPTRCVVFHSV